MSLDRVIHCLVESDLLERFRRHYPRKGALSDAMREGIEARIAYAEQNIVKQIATIGITNEPGTTGNTAVQNPKEPEVHDPRRTAGVRAAQPGKKAVRGQGTRAGKSSPSDPPRFRTKGS